MSPGDVADARSALAAALADLESSFPATPAGLGITVAWGLPYLRRFVPKQAAEHVPVDLRASKAAGREVRVIEDAERFQSDPEATILEATTPSSCCAATAWTRSSRARTRWSPSWTSGSRPASAGGSWAAGSTAAPACPSRWRWRRASAARRLIPDSAELFLGFTSTQKASLGPARIANIETLGYADRRAGGYFKQGTTMHLSHITQDLEGWYLIFDHGQRVPASSSPSRRRRRTC